MTVVVNGEARELPDATRVAELVAPIVAAGRAIAVEINCRVVARATWDATVLTRGDVVEIVSLVGGG